MEHRVAPSWRPSLPAWLPPAGVPRWLGATLIVLAGCEMQAPSQQKAVGDVTLSPAAYTIVQQSCLPCHDRAPFPAGIDLTTPVLPAEHRAAWSDGLAAGVAPFGVPRLLPDELATLMAYGVETGATWALPRTIRWRLEDALAGVPDGPASGPGLPGFGWVVEDGYRDGWDGPSRWGKVTRDGQPAIRFDWSDRAADGNLPSSYWFPLIEYHGEILEARVTGTVLLGRWASIGLGGHAILGGGRDGRRYGARLTIDRREIGLRSAPTEYECCAWTDLNDESLVGHLKEAIPGDQSGLYSFEFEQSQRPGIVRFEARVWRDGVLLADLWGESERDAGVPGGFFLHRYSLGFAEWRGLDLVATTGAKISHPPPRPPRDWSEP